MQNTNIADNLLFYEYLKYSMFGRGKFKGNKTTITYWRSHTKKTIILFYFVYIFMVLVFATIFTVILSVEKNPDNINRVKTIFAGAMIFFVFGF